MICQDIILEEVVEVRVKVLMEGIRGKVRGPEMHPNQDARINNNCVNQTLVRREILILERISVWKICRDLNLEKVDLHHTHTTLSVCEICNKQLLNVFLFV